MRFWATLVLTVLAAGRAEARDVALVVGNNAYQNVARLNTAVADARAVATQMEKLGFVVRRAIDVDQRAMSRALSAFDADLQPGDRAFFFYAGHGMEISGGNYLLPTDVPAAQANQRDLVRDASVPVERVIDGIRERGASVAVLVLDACRDNPFAAAGTRSAAITGGLARVDAPEGVFVLMSAGAKQEAMDRLSDTDPNPDSVFTRTFLHELAAPRRTLVQIAKATQVGVKNLAATVGYEQTPAYYDQVIGDVVLSESGPATPPPQDPPSPLATRADPPPLPPTRQQQFAALPQPLMQPPPPGDPRIPQVGGRAPLASFTRSNQGWTAYISLPEPALAISYRIGEAGEFRATGLTDILDQRTGERMPNMSFPMSARAQAGPVQILYQTPDGNWLGPFTLRFDPDVELFREQKKILNQLVTSWVQFGNGDNASLVYFTALVSYRCAISELNYGLNGNPPLARFDLPACNARDPFSIPNGATLYIRVPAKTESINLRITWRDGTQSDISTIER